MKNEHKPKPPSGKHNYAHLISKSTSLISKIERTDNVKMATLIGIAIALNATPENISNIVQPRESEIQNDYKVLKTKYDLAIKEIESLQNQLKDKIRIIELLEKTK